MASTTGNKHQRLYREVNKRIREVSDLFGKDGPVEFLCECGREHCTATFALTQAQFDGLASGAERVLLAAEHRRSLNGRRIVAEYQDFLVLAAD